MAPPGRHLRLVTGSPEPPALPSRPAPLRVLVADPHALSRAGLRTLLFGTEDLEAVGEACTAAEAVLLAEALRPDVVVVDPRLPDARGGEAVTRILAAARGAQVLVLSGSEDEGSVLAAVRAGARGYALKGSDEEHILRAVRAVASGEAIFGAGVAERLLGSLAGVPARPARAFPDLTERERGVLEHLARGLSNGQIALALHLSPKTVRNYVSLICTKLGVADRVQAALEARDAGLGPVEAT